MSRCCLPLLLVFTACAVHRPLRGSYSFGNPTMHLETLEFRGIDSFRHFSNDINTMSDSWGAGTYRLKGHHLTLRYGLPIAEGTPAPEVSFEPGTDSSVHIALQARATTGTPLSFMAITIRNRQVSTDAEGNASLRYRKNAGPDTLRGVLAGYPPLFFVVNQAGSYRLQLYSLPAGKAPMMLYGERRLFVKARRRRSIDLSFEGSGRKPRADSFRRYRRLR